jgi:cleavage stimulation factor subunit 3
LEEQQKMDALRKVYHRAVQIPLDNVERLWQELEAFETNLNRITAKKFMADLSPAHMQARTVLRQLINHVGAIYPPDSPEIFLPSLPKFDASERALVGKWKAYLKWEESNPLEIEEKDRATLITRIQGVYRKAVIRMRYYTEIWYKIIAILFFLVSLTLRPSQVYGLHVDKQRWKVR